MYLESRQWDLRHCEREKRTYRKRNSECWEGGIVAKRKQYRPALLRSELSTDNEEQQNIVNPPEDCTKLTVSQLRAAAKEKNPHAKGLSKMRKSELIKFLRNL